MKRIYFLNDQTGYACGNGFNNTSQNNFAKTTNSGVNWFSIIPPDPFEVYHDFSILNEDTIWLVSRNSPTGGVFRTTNGGTSWIRQSNAGDYPDKIFMFNARIGFIGFNGGTPTTKKTTNGGFNWFPVLNEGFTDIYFIDSLTGWKCWGERDSIKKTTDGGTTWQKQLLPPTGGFYALSVINDFAVLNADTIWGVGAVSNLIRGLIYMSSDGGTTWNYQLPDTSINIPRYYHTQFLSRLNGWAYSIYNGVHTVTGGNITSISQTGSEVPEDFKLFQNYPNPFNPVTTIEFKVKSSKDIKLTIYDIRGSEISVLVNEKLNAGEYQYVFDAGSLSNGVYFYSLYADGKIVDTKKMVLVR